MQNMTKAIYLFVVFSVVGCSTIIVVDTSTPSSIQQELEEGDRIRLTTTNDEFFQLIVVNLTDTAIEAHDEEDEAVAIPYEEVARVSMRQRQVGRTAAAVAGGIGMAAFVLYALAGVAAAVVLAGGL